MDINKNAITLNEFDLLHMINQYNFHINELAQLPSSATLFEDNQKVTKGSDNLAKLTKEKLDLLQKAVYNITSPVKIIRAHFTVGEKSIVRSLFSLGVEEKIVRTTKVGEDRHIELLDKEDFLTIFKQYIGNTNITKLPLSVELSSQALLVLLAAVDQIKHIRLYSTLTKSASVEMFSVLNILDRLNEADKDDFNWMILFIDKVFPLNIANSLTENDVLNSFLELETKGFIEKDESGFYSFTENGSVLVEVVLENISKIAVGISEQLVDNKIGHEVLLFVRSINNLLLFDFSGKDGVVAFLSRDDYELLIKGLLKKTEVIKMPPAKPEAKSGKTFCPSCNSPVEPGQKFCESCGHKLVKSNDLKCPSCKKILEPGSKFCDKCGTKIL